MTDMTFTCGTCGSDSYAECGTGCAYEGEATVRQAPDGQWRAYSNGDTGLIAVSDHLQVVTDALESIGLTYKIVDKRD